MVGALRWLETQRDLASLPVGLFGASTGAAAALLAAATSPRVRAVVSRGGRPDLAGEALREVRCPTLLIVGGADRDVLELNQRAMHAMTCPTQLEVVAGATHLFEEPGALEQVAALAARWFRRHVAQVATTAAPPSP
jgi:dienelactone hydrolase